MTISDLYDEMKDKYGFDDGNNIPLGIESARRKLIQYINKRLPKDSQKLVAYDRAGAHNWCMVVWENGDEPTELLYEILYSEEATENFVIETKLKIKVY